MNPIIRLTHPTNRPNFAQLQLGGLTIWFSYETPIAFDTLTTGIVIRENEWGPTTGKHMNFLSGDYTKRVTGVVFKELLNQAAAREAARQEAFR